MPTDAQPFEDNLAPMQIEVKDTGNLPNWLVANRAPSSPSVDRLRVLLEGATPENVRSALAEAAALADRTNAGELALLVEVAKKFSEAYPGEPLPIAA